MHRSIAGIHFEYLKSDNRFHAFRENFLKIGIKLHEFGGAWKTELFRILRGQFSALDGNLIETLSYFSYTEEVIQKLLKYLKV